MASLNTSDATKGDSSFIDQAPFEAEADITLVTLEANVLDEECGWDSSSRGLSAPIDMERVSSKDTEATQESFTVKVVDDVVEVPPVTPGRTTRNSYKLDESPPGFRSSNKRVSAMTKKDSKLRCFDVSTVVGVIVLLTITPFVLLLVLWIRISG
jgi:hypothetical protein